MPREATEEDWKRLKEYRRELDSIKRELGITQPVTLTYEQANILEMYILLTTQHRQGEISANTRLSQETNEDGSLKYPNAGKNAEWWTKADIELNAIAGHISDVVTRRIKEPEQPATKPGIIASLEETNNRIRLIRARGQGYAGGTEI
jgi:hypothetical protein